MKPLVLLDVDGVINDLQRWVDRPWSHTDHLAAGYLIRIPDYMPELLARVHAAADIIWCTTWEENANEFIAPLVGLPIDLPVARLSHYMTSTVTAAKVDSAYHLSAPYREARVPVAWIEDFDAPMRVPGLTPLTTVPDYVLTPEGGEFVLEFLAT